MDKNTKLLVLISLITIVAGFFLIWFGVRSIPDLSNTFPTPTESLNVATSSAVSGTVSQLVKVVKVIDGDTIEIEDGKVRYIGVDTPETVDPRRPVGCFGKEASNENKSLVEGKEVILEKDISDTDKFGRLLRYVYLPLEGDKGLFINDYLIREGFARVSTFPPDVKYTSQFLEAEKIARENKKGLWGRCEI